MNQRNWAYLAGLIDGDGTFFIHFETTRSGCGSPSFSPVIAITLHEGQYSVLNQLNNELGNTRKVKLQNSKGRHHASLTVTRKALVKNILENIIPYLRVKKKRGKLLLKAVKIMDNVKPPLPRSRIDIMELAKIRDKMSELSFGDKGKHRKKWTYEAIEKYVNDIGYGTKERYDKMRKKCGEKSGFKKGHIPWNKGLNYKREDASMIARARNEEAKITPET